MNTSLTWIKHSCIVLTYWLSILISFYSVVTELFVLYFGYILSARKQVKCFWITGLSLKMLVSQLVCHFC